MIDEAKLKQAEQEITAAGSDQALQALRVKYLGRNGLVTAALTEIGNLPTDKRGAAGRAANEAKQRLEVAIKRQRDQILASQIQAGKSADSVDVTAPVKTLPVGHLHPLSQILQDLIYEFWQMGFQVAEGPEIEDPWYNFDALNIPKDHPARDMQDTFYLTQEPLLPRTHTSPVQIRYMKEHQPPIRIVVPGKVYRNEDEDPRHVWMFYQMEGLVVDKGITLSHLKGTLLAMVQGIFGKDTKIRLRPSFFPYTEPSVEVDASCIVCGGKGCHTCSGTGWIEILGAGMVHPQVLQNVGLDPAVYSGFAFGVGLERLAVIKYQVADLRVLWRPNLNFLEQF